MRKRRFGRKGVSTMIGGIIVLTLFLTALTAMVLISQQYDTYQTTLDSMSQQDVDQLSENLAFPYPGLSSLTSVSGLNQYNMTVSNLSGIGTQVARIYITQPDSAAYPLLILNPSSTPSSYTFSSHTSFINPGEASHQVLLWLPSSVTLISNYPEANSVNVVTSRGRVFSFQWPFPPAGVAVPTGSTVDMGPFRISIDYNMITYTTTTQTAPGAAGCANADPSPTPCLAGGWTFPVAPIVFFVKLYNLGGSNIILEDKSALIAHPYATSGASADIPFYIVQPMSSSCLNTYFAASYFDGSWTTISYPTTCPIPTSIRGYNATYPTPVCSEGNPCYNIPAGPALGQPGQEEYVLFSAAAKGGTSANTLFSSGNCGSSGSCGYEVSLALYYLYNGYSYSMTLPLLSIYT